MHRKKSMMPTAWPVPRKGVKKRFMAIPAHAPKKGISLLFVLRDLLSVARTRKEAQKILHAKQVQVNGIVRTNDAFPLQVLDTLALEKLNKFYRLEIENRKFVLTEITKKDVMEKIVKINGKKVIDKKHTQINFEDGNNIISSEKCNVGDSAVLNSKEKKIVKILPLKVSAKVEVISGKHAGKEGVLKEEKKLIRGKVYTIKFEDGLEVDLPYKTILVIG